MRAPSFWWKPTGVRARLLKPASLLYGAVAGRRMRREGQSVGVPIVCIGGLTVGGAGKTPTALAVARLLAGAGRQPVFLTRGFGGRAEGPLVVDLEQHGAEQVGDEALLLAREFPTVVSRDRIAGARAAHETGADVVVMDDGFQNPSLRKSYSLVVIDAAHGVGNARVFPAGPLRASIAVQAAKADAFAIVGADNAALETIIGREGRPIFRARLVADAAISSILGGRKLLAYAGIAHPTKFFDTLRTLGLEVAQGRPFPDHHVFSEHDAEALLAQANREGDLQLVTTEKDYARLPGTGRRGELRRRSIALPVTLVFAEPTELLQDIMRAISRAA